VNKSSRVYIAGHNGLVGSAIKRLLEFRGFTNILGYTRHEVDLLDQSETESFFKCSKPEYVFLAAAKVGGIKANNDYPAEFIYENLQIQTNVIHSAQKHGAKKVLLLGSSCIYPNTYTDAIGEDKLLAGNLEPTNQWYAIAKIAGIYMGRAYRRQYGLDVIAAMPTNLYGPNDDYDPLKSHVLPAMIQRFHNAKVNNLPVVDCWGTGTPRREFLHVDDCAEASIFLMENYSDEGIVNVGYGSDVTIAELAATVAKVVGYQGAITWDHTKPDGTMRKLIDSSKLFNMGWKPKIDLVEGITATYPDFIARVVKPEQQRVVP
jgi:GDP-L-fucose synthase